MKMESSETNKLRYTTRWFAYFDLLGFTNLVRSNRIGYVISVYEDVLKTIAQKADPKKKSGLSYSWFSDTFILFTKGSTEKEFALIEQASRLFFQRLILRRIPVRGSLSVGPLYTQQQKNIFIGEALIDAYEYGEKQAWLGFVLTPNVHNHVKGSCIEVDRRLNYRRIDDPAIITHDKPHNVFAYAFNNGTVNGKNPFLNAIKDMRESAGVKYASKYDKTEAFIRLHGNYRPIKSN